jgi:tetratricopeptide (TPR) repeat protein
MKDELKKRIENEINNNRIWKAKEILQGMIKSQPYDEELYYQYAKILYNLGDFVESGKYFLLSDTSSKEYKQAIDEFLKRYDAQNYFSHFPRMFKKVPINNYPKNLKNLMIEKPTIQRYIKEYQEYQNDYQSAYKEDFIDKAMGIFIGLIVLLIISIFLLGAGVLIKYLWSLL